MSHLEEVTDADIAALSRARVVAVLLPTTQYILRIKCPPARKLIEKGTITILLGLMKVERRFRQWKYIQTERKKKTTSGKNRNNKQIRLLSCDLLF